MIVKLWFAEENNDVLSLLDEADQALLATLHKGKAKEQSSIAQALMKQAAMELGYSAVRITRSEKGAPVTDIPQLFVSATHTDGCCAAAAAHHPVGIDAQPVEACREKVMARLYSEKEQAFVCNHADKNYAFNLLWTLKEAYGKMKGVGLSAAKEVEFLWENGELHCSDRRLRFSSRQEKNILISTVEQLSD